MRFRLFIESDLPFPEEEDVLDKIRGLDLVSQLRADIGLHKGAISGNRFSAGGDMALAQDMPLKRKAIAILSGKISDPVQISQVIQGLRQDLKTHADYLAQPPNHNTGSHAWHKAWIGIYENLLQALSNMA